MDDQASLSKRDKGEDRDERGRFRPGHGVKSPGNPAVVRMAEYRAAIREAVTPSDLVAVLAVLLERALEGDLHAAREILNRAVGRPLAATPGGEGDFSSIPLPPLRDSGDLIAASGMIFEAVGNGTLGITEAGQLFGMLGIFRQVLETGELENRITKLEVELEERAG